MDSKPNNSGGTDNDTHYLIQLKEAPDSLIALREELLKHPDICEYAVQGDTFEDCLGRIALKLDIALDGMYDIQPLCAMLVSVLRKRHMFGANPHLRHKGLISAELVETEKGVELREAGPEVTVPADAVVLRSDTSESIPTVRPEIVNKCWNYKTETCSGQTACRYPIFCRRDYYPDTSESIPAPNPQITEESDHWQTGFEKDCSESQSAELHPSSSEDSSTEDSVDY